MVGIMAACSDPENSAALCGRFSGDFAIACAKTRLTVTGIVGRIVLMFGKGSFWCFQISSSGVSAE
jgi:hypothetical protein